MRHVHVWIRHPWFQLLLGLILAATGLSKALDGLDKGLDMLWKPGAHHGLMLLGVVKALESLPDVIEGVEKVHDRTRPETREG